MSLLTFVIVLTLFTAGLALYLSRSRGKSKFVEFNFPASGQPLFGDGTVGGNYEPGTMEKPEPIYAVWHDGPRGRDRRRHGRVVRRKGARIWIVPKDAQNTVVRRRMSACLKVQYN